MELNHYVDTCKDADKATFAFQQPDSDRTTPNHAFSYFFSLYGRIYYRYLCKFLLGRNEDDYQVWLRSN